MIQYFNPQSYTKYLTFTQYASIFNKLKKS